MNSNTKSKHSQSKARTPVAMPVPADDDRTLKIPAEDGKTSARMLADLVTRGDVLNALTAMRFAKPEFGSLDLSEMAASLRESGVAINRGDLSEAERMLHAQAVSLNAIFSELARRSQINMGEYLDASERYMRLALRAQSQCRATLESLAAIKNPPVVYTRQMNYANGPQQVNNATAENNGKPQPPRTQETQTRPNKLLEDLSNGSTQLDTRATTTAARGHRAVATVGEVNRPDQPRGKGGVKQERLEGGARAILREIARALRVQRRNLKQMNDDAPSR